MLSDNSGLYPSCSSNPDCECIALFNNESTRICIYSLISCSILTQCSGHEPCRSGTVCVNNSRCGKKSVCMPMALATQEVCPQKPGKYLSWCHYVWILDTESNTSLFSLFIYKNIRQKSPKNPVKVFYMKDKKSKCGLEYSSP